jgi:hypothetical protein
MESKEEEFYIGYQASAPASLARYMRGVVIALMLCAGLVACLLARGHNRYARAFFDFGNVREFTGTLLLQPVPTLIASTQEETSYALVGVGKHGIEPVPADLNGKAVRLQGTLIERDGMKMIEVQPTSLRADNARAELPSVPAQAAGEIRLRGMIVDGKCYLGVMNPGEGKPHRECAVRCISGGIPPLFVAQDETGKTDRLWLVGTDGSAINDRVLDYIAEPVEIVGFVQIESGQLVLRAAPENIRRLP